MEEREKGKDEGVGLSVVRDGCSTTSSSSFGPDLEPGTAQQQISSCKPPTTSPFLPSSPFLSLKPSPLSSYGSRFGLAKKRESGGHCSACHPALSPFVGSDAWSRLADRPSPIRSATLNYSREASFSKGMSFFASVERDGGRGSRARSWCGEVGDDRTRVGESQTRGGLGELFCLLDI